MTTPLKLRAVDEDDLAVLAACLQDALVPVHDMRFLAGEASFVLVANRFCWEKLPADVLESPIAEGGAADIGEGEESGFERIHSALSVEHVRRVQTRGFSPHDPADAERLLEVLTFMAEESGEDGSRLLTLVFAGGAAVRLEVEKIEVIVQDVGEPWPTMWRPNHPLEGEPGEGGAA